MMSPGFITSPTFTSGRWLMQVDWLERWNLCSVIDVHARLAGFDLARGADDDTGGVDLIDNAGTRSRDGSAGIARHGLFHAGADERRFGLEPTARPDAACSIPSARGWRHRFPGTE
jgi:hypothetical protein